MKELFDEFRKNSEVKYWLLGFLYYLQLNYNHFRIDGFFDQSRKTLSDCSRLKYFDLKCKETLSEWFVVFDFVIRHVAVLATESEINKIQKYIQEYLSKIQN